MDFEAAQDFAVNWASEWNAHDLDAILSHYTDDVVFSSPFAAQVVAGSNGLIRGKDALREYWAAGLDRLPDLRFEVVGVYAGVDTVVINYRNQAGQLVNEVLTFRGDLIVSGCGTYGPPAAAERT